MESKASLLSLETHTAGQYREPDESNSH